LKIRFPNESIIKKKLSQLHLVKIIRQRESQGKQLQTLALLGVGRERENKTPMRIIGSC